MQPSGAPQPSHPPVPEPGAAPVPAPRRHTGPPVPMPDMCLACGQMLKQADVACPSCGAAVRGVRKARGLDKLKVAGFLLVAISGVTIFLGVAFLVQTEESVQGGQNLPVGNYTLSGFVRDANGTGVQGVAILAPGVNGSSGPDGSFELQGLRGGYQEVDFRSGEGGLVLRTFFWNNERADVILPAGQATAFQNHSSYSQFLSIFKVLAGAIAGAGALIFLAAIACYRKRRFSLALAGAIVAIVAGVVYLPMILLGIVATVLVSRSRKDFR